MNESQMSDPPDDKAPYTPRAERPDPERTAKADALQRDASDVAEGDARIDALRSLAVPAPADVFLRFRRRAAVVQGTRMLFESQVIGFWVVLDALLRLLLGSRPGSMRSGAIKNETPKTAGPKTATQNAATYGEGA